MDVIKAARTDAAEAIEDDTSRAWICPRCGDQLFLTPVRSSDSWRSQVIAVCACGWRSRDERAAGSGRRSAPGRAVALVLIGMLVGFGLGSAAAAGGHDAPAATTVHAHESFQGRCVLIAAELRCI